MFGEVTGDAPKHLEGGVLFRFNFSVEENGTSGQGEQQQRQEEKEKHQHRLASSSATRSAAPAFEVFPDSIDISSRQLDAVDLALPSGPIFKVRVAGSEAGGRIAIGEKDVRGGGGTGRGGRPSASSAATTASSSAAATASSSSSSSLAHSDLVPGVYEGGFKLWEGAVDLARLLAEEVIETTDRGVPPSPTLLPRLSASPVVPLDNHLPRWLPGAPRPPSLHGARVLELGCGSALPSLVAAKAAGKRRVEGKGRRGGPVSIMLCDFNAEVLKTCAAANVAANFGSTSGGEDSEAQKGESPFFRYFAGDWSNLSAALERAGALSSGTSSSPSSPYSSSSGFDLILAAEVTYSSESYLPLADAIADLLAAPPAKSAALVAAKRHYFGVGGNVEGFIKTATARGRLRVERVAVVEGPLPRDVLLLTRI